MAMTLATMPADALAPLLPPESLRLTAEQFEAVRRANPHAVLELDANGQLIQISPPTVKRAPGIKRLVSCSGLPFANLGCRSSSSIAPRGFAYRMALC